MTASGMGAIGLAVTGGVFFNDLSNPDGSLALTNEVTSSHSYVIAVIDCDIALPLHVRAPVWTRVWATAHPQEEQEVVVPLAAAPLAEVRAPLLAGEVRRHPGDGHTGPLLPGGGGRPTPRTPRTPASTTTTATSTAPRPGPPPAPPTPTPASS